MIRQTFDFIPDLKQRLEPGESMPPCEGFPVSKTGVRWSDITPGAEQDNVRESNVSFDDATGQPRLNLQHLQNVFFILVPGYLLSILAFAGELIWFKISGKGQNNNGNANKEANTEERVQTLHLESIIGE